MDICVIGLGAVGLVHGACMAEIGHRVICVDKDKEKVDCLNRGIMPIFEEGLKEMVKRNVEAERLYFTTDIGNGIRSATVIFICVGTPMNSNGSADITQVMDAALSIAENLNQYKIVAVKSTVPVGTSSVIKNLIRQYRGGNYDVDVVSNPEFLREGSSIYDTFNSDRIVIGGSSQIACKILKEVYRNLDVPVITVSPESAEMIKYASNTFLAMKISFINEIANLCDKVGADINEVAKGMGMDKRIGGEFLKAGLGFGGSCFTKDINAIIRIAEEYNYDFKIAKQILEVNERQKLIPVQILENHLGELKDKDIAILGLAFKPGTDDMRYAPSVDIINALKNKGCRIRAYDPVVREPVKPIPPEVEIIDDLYSAVMDCYGIVLVTEWKEFIEMDIERIYKNVRMPLFIDGRNCMDAGKMKAAGFIYKGIGIRL
jgi:UDPglucose 6-dehydrogenase